MKTAVVIIASTRASAGIYPDRTGPLIAEWLTARGFQVTGPRVVADGPEVERALREAVGADMVITSGGTGISPTDRTPQATAAILDYDIPGLASAIRQQGSDAVPTAVLSRGLAGVAGRTLVVNLPGSTGGVSDGLVVLDRVLDHALEQISGGDHESASHHQQSVGHRQSVGHQQTSGAPLGPGAALAPGQDLSGRPSAPGDEPQPQHAHPEHQSQSDHQHADGTPDTAADHGGGGAQA